MTDLYDGDAQKVKIGDSSELFEQVLRYEVKSRVLGRDDAVVWNITGRRIRGSGDCNWRPADQNSPRLSHLSM